MYPFDDPHNCYNPRNSYIMPNRKEEDQHPSPHFSYPPYPSNYPHPSYYHYGPPHLPYVQPPPVPLPHCYYPHYYPPHPTYFIPPPPPCNYPMDHHHPGYDDYYNHHSNRPHCCGCANHTCQPRNNASSSLTIQEEPFHQSEGGESNDAVPPSNYTPPIVWRLPSSDSVKANNSDNKYDEKASEKDDAGKTGSQSPSYPVIWLPRNPGFEEMARDKNATASKSAQEWPSNLKFAPMKFLENGSSAEPKSEVHQVTPPADKKSNIRTIPVKKVDDISFSMSGTGTCNMDKRVGEVERNQSSNVKNAPLIILENGEDNRLKKDVQQEAHDPVEKKEIKIKIIPVKHMDEKSSDKSCNTSTDKNKKETKLDGKEESKTNNTSEKKKLSTKSSKLPPVCLRVDPRPRKTSANSSNTSKPSTTTTTNRNAKTNKESNCGNEKPTHEKITPVNVVNECSQSEPVIPVNFAEANNLSQDKNDQVCEESMTVASPEKNASTDDSSRASEVISKGNNIENCEKTGIENFAKTSELKMIVDEEKAEKPIGKMDEKPSGKRVLSETDETDAATIIQSAYRGFEVRKWHTLEKLKKIAKVRKETDNVRRQVDDIEACPPHQLDAKKKVVLGEAIMNLLLQLDTIQGLHPSVKEVRKSIANELTSLEDKLDSIYSRVAKEHDSSRLDTNEAESSNCEGNIVCSAPDTSKLESAKQDSMDDKISTSDAELQNSDDGAADVTSSTLVCEADSELDVQVDDNGTKNNEIIQEKSPSVKERVEEEEISDELKHPCFERENANKPYDMDSTVLTPSSSSSKPFVPASEEDTNLSNVLVHQAEDEHVTSKQDEVSDLEEKDNLVEDKETGSVAELQTRSDDGAAVVTSSTLVCEAAREHDVQVDDKGMKNHEIIQEEKSPSFEERVEEEQISEEVKHPCFERDMDSSVSTPSSSSEEDTNPSNVLVHQAEDEHVTSKQDEVSDLEEKDNLVEDKETGSVAELQTRSDDGAADVTSSTLVCEAARELDVQVDDKGMKNHEIIQEEKSPSFEERVEEEQISEEVKHPCFERDMDSSVSTPSSSSVEDKNPSNVLVHQAEDEHVTLKQENVGDLEEEKDNSAENKETRSIVERPADYAEPKIASDELPNVNIASDDALEERSSALKSDGDSFVVIGNESENAAYAGMLEDESRKMMNSCAPTSHADEDLFISVVKENTAAVVDRAGDKDALEAVTVDEDKQMISEGFEAPEASTEEADIASGRKMGDDSTKNDEKDFENEVFVSNKGAADEVSDVLVCKEGEARKKEEVQLIEENEKLRKMIENLVQSGNKQLDVITNLTGRVKDLEKKLQLTKKKRMRVRRNKAVKNHSNGVGGN